MAGVAFWLQRAIFKRSEIRGSVNFKIVQIQNIFFQNLIKLNFKQLFCVTLFSETNILRATLFRFVSKLATYDVISPKYSL